MVLVVQLKSPEMAFLMMSKRSNAQHEALHVEEQERVAGEVTSQLYLTQLGMGRDMVLRRIRHQKRMNKVKEAVQLFMASSRLSPPAGDGSLWLHDAFSDP